MQDENGNMMLKTYLMKNEIGEWMKNKNFL